MTFQHFFSLNQAEQLQLVKEKGVFIGDHMEESLKCVSYRVYAFYVELLYKTPENLFVGLKAFFGVSLPEVIE